MRPYQSEVVIQDRETRSLNVLLESAAAPGEKPMLRVAVGCADSDPKGPEDGLTIEVDNEALPAGSVKQRWSADAGRKFSVWWDDFTLTGADGAPVEYKSPANWTPRSPVAKAEAPKVEEVKLSEPAHRRRIGSACYGVK